MYRVWYQCENYDANHKTGIRIYGNPVCNGFLEQYVMADDTSKFTLQIGLNTLLTPYGNNYNLLIAGSMFGILPILIIYLIFQRYLIDGMTSGAVKG